MPRRVALPGLLVERLAHARSVGVITGAGVSAESGIQTYRGSGGLYDDPDEGDRTVEALSHHTLVRDPDRTWRTLADLARRAEGAEPNAGHRALVEIERRVERFALLTQNVDGLHQRAGSRNVIDIHGTIFDTRCMGCDAPGRLEELGALAAAPRCARCGAILRPDVVLFGELLDPEKLRRVHEAFYVRVPEVVIVAGTTALFPYIGEPVVLAREAGALTVEVNPEPTAVSQAAQVVLRAPAGEALPLLAEALSRGAAGG
ncbi:MAG: NAD-dependent protein deacylase [Deltaproteobacteria bacterium]|nr:NAD-dependent protein deacylase [Deltaproteobacteria bacterium]